MNYYKHYLLTLLFSFFVLISGHILPLLLIDPLNISKFELTKNEFFINEMRFQSATIINRFDFDSAIVGTSMTANFIASEANEKLGGTFHNFSLDGSLLSERKVLLDYLFSKKKIKTLIISIDGATNIQQNKGIPIEAWSFLYNESLLDDYSVYTNRKFSRYLNCHSIFDDSLSSFIFGACPENTITSKLGNLVGWQSNPFHNSRFGGIEKWLKYKKNSQVSQSIEVINIASTLVQNKELNVTKNNLKYYDPIEFSKNIVPLIKKHPQTRFILYFPPYSIFKYAIDAQTQTGFFLQYKELVKQVVLESEFHPNAEVYWFGDKVFVSDISSYKDLTHHNGYYNSVFLDEFSMKRSIIDVSNYKILLSNFESKVNAVNLVELAKKLN